MLNELKLSKIINETENDEDAKSFEDTVGEGKLFYFINFIIKKNLTILHSK